eukprot:421005-Ditylum_brightwellii.AAC.2
MKCAASCYTTGASVYQSLTAIGIKQNTVQIKVCNVVGVDNINQLQNKKLKHHEFTKVLNSINMNSAGHPTLLSRNEEALCVATTEIEGAHDKTVGRYIMSEHLNACLNGVAKNKDTLASERKPKSQLHYACSVISQVNAREGNASNQKRSNTGEIK